MIPLTNDQLREQFRKIYGRMPASLFELDQFRKNRPTRFYEPRTFKKKRKLRKSGITLPTPELSPELLQSDPASVELMLDLPDEEPQTAKEDAADMHPAEENHQEENEGKPESDQGMIDGKL